VDKQLLIKAAQEIASHAANPPKQPGETGRRINPLSPHFERLTAELIRNVLIKRTQMAEKRIADELIRLRKLLPDGSQPQLDHSVAIINEILQLIYQ
jgi:hypothetical protein